ncbi:MAG: RNA pseudouridine synthase [Elusimicrobiota bacterium]|nr:MAG: RNA pseudouridine synthase [Elusimicrobiota bacterium]
MIDAAVVHEDDRIIAVNKPCGRPTIPGRGEIAVAVNIELERRLRKKVFTVHRLDLDASGILVFAKDPETHRLLSMEFEERRAKKEYLVAVLGVMAGSGTIDKPLREFSSGRVAPAPDGKRAVTHWRVEKPLRGSTLLRVTTETGRKHQIRAHLSSEGHPVLGDPRYGPPPRPVGGAKRLMLHAWTLKLELGYDLTAEPDAEFAGVLAGRGG